jgi:hypothetical protein
LLLKSNNEAFVTNTKLLSSNNRYGRWFFQKDGSLAFLAKIYAFFNFSLWTKLFRSASLIGEKCKCHESSGKYIFVMGNSFVEWLIVSGSGGKVNINLFFRWRGGKCPYPRALRNFNKPNWSVD